MGDEYRDEYVRNWTTIWTNLLIGRTGGMDKKSLANREGMEQYLAETLKYNKPYDEFATQLITATGSCRPGDKDFNGAANFLADKMADNGIQATAKTAQIFLGMAVQCTQCHNHPFNEYQQNQFWELNAFFRQTHVEKEPIEDKKNRNVGRVVDRDFKGEGGDPKKAEIYYEQRNGKLKVAYPVFVDGTSLDAMYASRGESFGDHGMLADVNRRTDLAKLVVKSREFDRAIANRLWGHFLGYGFTKPVDDIGPHNQPSHPELLDGLGASLRDAKFDVKELMRWIVLSEPYGLSSRMTKHNEADDPALGAADVQSFLFAADGSGGAVRVAAGGDGGGGDGGEARRSRDAEAAVARAVQHGVWDGRQRRVVGIQRDDSAGADADEWAAGEAGDRESAGEHVGEGGGGREHEQRGQDSVFVFGSLFAAADAAGD